MDVTVSAILMIEQDRQISDVMAKERPRLRNFIRRRVPDEADVEDLVQEVFYELVQAHRLLKPIDYVTGWLYTVARNRITDLFRKRKPQTFADMAIEGEDGELLNFEDMLPSSEAGPEALYIRSMIFDELEAAIAELPADQREVFIAHEFEGRSFKEIAEETGVNFNTLLARKRYAVRHLRERLQTVYDELSTK